MKPCIGVRAKMASRVYNVTVSTISQGCPSAICVVRNRLGSHRHYLYSVHFRELAITRLDSREKSSVVFLACPATHPCPVQEEQNDTQTDDKNDAKHQNGAGIFAGPVSSLEDLPLRCDSERIEGGHF